MTLQHYFSAHPRGALAFSGGTDSAFLLWAALEAGAEVQPFFIDTPFQPRWERQGAEAFCRSLDIPLTVLEAKPLSCPGIRENPANRCYYCKRLLFTTLHQAAEAAGYSLLWEGTNASDDAGDRPGMQALAELKVESPLRLCGLTKTEIRRRSRAAGLPTWDKPSYACLATRFPTGRVITPGDLARIEAGEQAVMDLGFSDLRLRLRDWGGLLQLPAGQQEGARRRWGEITAVLEPLFSEVRLDPTARCSH
ncbi:MAG: TIGR00268 family protein [Candidatus Onthomonas sp.]